VPRQYPRQALLAGAGLGSVATVLRQVADGVLIHESEFVQSNAVVVNGPAGVLLIDPGILEDELVCLAKDLADSGQTVAVGFSTHPHWDHLLWHEAFGDAPRYSTAGCATTAHERLSGDLHAIAKAVGIPTEVPLDLLGRITGLPAGTTQIPWDGPVVTIVEHQAHAHGHAALVIADRGVLVAGDMLSDLLIPLLDLRDASSPIGDYLAAIELLAGVAGDVEVLIPGHGSVGDANELRARIDQDRAYVEALRDGRDSGDSRIGPAAKPGTDWVRGAHERQLAQLAQRGDRA
jgi:glyoxylase-like metal-dependent hydrolase (beta-lactamase superfamily II)